MKNPEKDLLLFSKKPRKVAYKPKQSPLSSVPIELGKLGPDLDSDDLLYKKAVSLRVKDFSAQLREVNRRRTAFTSRSCAEKSQPLQVQEKPQTKRERMNSFAVPKPKAASRELIVETTTVRESREQEPPPLKPVALYERGRREEVEDFGNTEAERNFEDTDALAAQLAQHESDTSYAAQVRNLLGRI